VAYVGPFFYPDVRVVCGPPQFDTGDCLRNPVIVVEVLSESTSAYDRGAKFFHYRRLSSLLHYVLIEQNALLVEHYARQPNGLWTLVGEHTSRDHVLALDPPGVTIPLADIYRRLPHLAPGPLDSDIP